MPLSLIFNYGLIHAEKPCKENCVNEAIADGLRRRQNMLSDFNKAQDLLKNKVHEISRERDEFQETYNNREARDEDIEQIEQLNVIYLRLEFWHYSYSFFSI